MQFNNNVNIVTHGKKYCLVYTKCKKIYTDSLPKGQVKSWIIFPFSPHLIRVNCDLAITAKQVTIVTHVIFLKEAEVSNDPDPHQQSGGSHQDTADVIRGQILHHKHSHQLLKHSQISNTQTESVLHLGLDGDLDEGGDDGEDVTDDEQQIPAVDEL